MQSWQADPPDSRGLDPRAQWTPSRRSSFLFPLTVVFGVLVCCMLCAGGGVFWIVRQSASSEPLAPSESLDEQIAASTSAYMSDEIGVGGNALLQIERLFGRVQRATQSEDDTAFQQQVDFAALMAYVKQSRHAASANPVLLLVIRLQMSMETYVDPAWADIRLRRIEPIAGTNQFEVYTHCYDDEGSEYDFRFWVIQDDEEFKIADWQRFDLGLRHSDEWAIYAGHADDSSLEEYYQALEEINLAWDSAEDDPAESEGLLRTAAARRVPPEFEDSVCVLLGYQWNNLGDSDEALRCFEKVRIPDATPGAHFGRAIALAGQGDYAQAVDAIARYEAAVGSAPNTNRIIASWLDQLDRPAEEADEWRKVLRAEPDDDMALRSLAALLDDDELASLPQYFTRTREPLSSAASLAQMFASTGNEAGLETVREFARDTEPRSAVARYIAGLAKDYHGQLEEAAEQFREALKLVKDGSKKTVYRYAYLEAMRGTDRVLDAYRNVDDQRDAIRYWLAEYNEGESELAEDETDDIIAAHRDGHPSDPLGAYLAGLRWAERRQYANAGVAFKECVELAADDEWLLDAGEHELVSALTKAEKPMEAYRATDPPGERFATIAMICHEERRWDALRELVEEHRQHNPEELWLTLSQAALSLREGEFDEAGALLEQVARLDDDQRDYTINLELNKLRGHARLWEDAYEKTSDPDAAAGVFQSFAQSFADHGRIDDLRILLIKHQERFPTALHAAEWQRWLATTSDDLESYADRWFPLREQYFTDQENSWRLHDFANELVRVLLKVDRQGDAIEFATRLKEEHEDDLPMILCHAIAGDVAKAREYIDGHQFAYGAMYELYDDQDVGFLLRSSTYDELHVEHPMELPFSIADNEAILLVQKAPEWDASQLQTLLDDLAKNVRVTEIPDDGSGPAKRFAVAVGAARLLLSVHERTYRFDSLLLRQLDDSRHRRMLEDHTAWVSVAGSRWARPLDALDSHRLVCDVVKRLADANCLAIGLVEGNRLLENTPLEWTAWSNAKNKIERGGLGIHVDLYDDGVGYDVHSKRDVARAASQLRLAFNHRNPADSYAVAADLQVGTSSERLWISLDEIVNGTRYVGQLLDDSRLARELRRGKRLLIEEFEIAACRFEHDGQQVEAATVLMSPAQ